MITTTPLISSSLLTLFTISWAVSAGEQSGKPVLDPDLPYQAKRGNPVTYQVDYSVVITAPYHTRKLKVWLPLPQSDAGQDVTESELDTFPQAVQPRIGKEKKFGNQFAYFEFDNPQGAQIIRHRFSVKVWELHWDIDPSKVVGVERWPRRFDPYLQSDESTALNATLRRLLKEILPRSRGSFDDLATVLQWVNANMTYDHVNASLRASTEHALKERRGHCSDYHGLCAAFGRAIGYPTRVTYGINPFPKNSPSHCKLEVYLPPHGWISFDVSETQKLIHSLETAKEVEPGKKQELIDAAKQRLLRGFRDHTWFLQTRGTDYDLVPPASKRVSVVRTIYAEADGVALPDPDPANPEQRKFAWMTVHKYTPDRKVAYPFKDWKTLGNGR